jgi:hypothetical protein
MRAFVIALLIGAVVVAATPSPAPATQVPVAQDPAAITRAIQSMPAWAPTGPPSHNITFRVQYPATIHGHTSYFGINVQNNSAGAADALSYNINGWCIDREHGISTGAIIDGTWINLIDTTNAISFLRNIGASDESYTATNCQFTDAENAITLDTTVDPDAATELAATQSWCDARRFLKYRGAIWWILRNSPTIQGSNRCGSEVIHWGHIQTLFWYLLESYTVADLGAVVPRPGGRAVTQTCIDTLTAEALTHNDFTGDRFDPRQCSPGQYQQFVPILFVPNTCFGGDCNQHLVGEVGVPCYTPLSEAPTPAGQCTGCYTATESCQQAPQNLPTTGQCVCLSWVADAIPGLCEINGPSADLCPEGSAGEAEA